MNMKIGPLSISLNRSNKDYISFAKITKGTGSAWAGAPYALPKKNKISYENIEKVWRRDPLVKKGITKKADDIIGEWSIEDPRDGFDVPDEIENKIALFNTEHDVKNKLRVSAINWMLYGDFFLELDDGNTDPKAELFMGNLKDIHIIHPKTMKILTDKNNIITGYLFRYAGEKITFHPSRIIHRPHDPCGDSHYGLSVIENGYNIIISKMNADVATGEHIYRTAHPLPELAHEKLVPEKDKEAAQETLASLSPKTGIVSTNGWKFEMHNPTAINLRSYFDNYYVNLAAALGMPTMILLGVQKGAVTGSEVDLADYYNQITRIRTNIFSGVLREIYRALTGLDPFPYDIYWHPLMVDERSETEMFYKQVEAAEKLAANPYFPPELIWETIVNKEFNVDSIKKATGEIKAEEEAMASLYEAL